MSGISTAKINIIDPKFFEECILTFPLEDRIVGIGLIFLADGVEFPRLMDTRDPLYSQQCEEHGITPFTGIRLHYDSNSGLFLESPDSDNFFDYSTLLNLVRWLPQIIIKDASQEGVERETKRPHCFLIEGGEGPLNAQTGAIRDYYLPNLSEHGYELVEGKIYFDATETPTRRRMEEVDGEIGELFSGLAFRKQRFAWLRVRDEGDYVKTLFSWLEELEGNYRGQLKLFEDST